ncbi:MAG: caspase family protein [Planctomycetes bacterium]|nr:caspase family protein [Planctomycetota bacterium]MBL7037579.1 caspase family protein [Pirellulaceae bacterium]
MSRDIYALLVGINDYSPDVGKLNGCLNDVDRFHGYLTDRFGRSVLHIEVLKNADATRPNVIEQFRTHLCKAKADDVVVFQYCGHGARWKSAKPFEEFFPDGKDEGLVCYDSRKPGGFDLADKELAVLLAEVAKNDPHIAVILDCCHSGSATRGADDFTQLKARQTHEVLDERPLESYLDGYYAELRQRGASLEIPASRHILLAACQRVQKAWEARDHSGVFTSTLLEVLGKSGTDISYADLFVRCRAAVRKRADNQDPQFETYRSFSAYSGFLGHRASQTVRPYSVYFETGAWQVDCGALHGLPSDPDKKVELALYPESNRSHLAGHATTIQVGPQKSELELLDIDADTSTRYQAEITSLPVPPLAVYLEGDAERTESFQKFLAASEDRSFGISLLTDAEDGARYTLTAENGCYLLRLRETGKLIQGAKGQSQKAADHMFGILKRVAAWERAVRLQNHATKMDPDDIEFKYFESIGDEREHEYRSSEITLDMTLENGECKPVFGKLKAINRMAQPLHLLLVHLSDQYGIQPLYNERVEPTDSWFTVTLDGNAEFHLKLEDDEGDVANHQFKLIVSTEKVDDFLLAQEQLELGKIVSFQSNDRGTPKGLGFGKPRKKLVHENEWFTKDLHIKLVRQLDRVSANDTTLANRQITIKGHPSLQANISLCAAKTATRGVGTGSDIYRVLERQGMEMVDFSATRGDSESILELTDIQNPEVLAEDPLVIELDVELADDEFILPLAFDGEHILLTGDPSRDDEGRTHISIDHIPGIPDNRRSVGKALKLYFFKTYLRRENVNRLCWVEYKDDGSAERRRSGVAEKVAAAENVLLLIHGIIGDTRGIAEGLRNAKDADGKSVDQRFDLVLNYDYENLSTPISETAVMLKQQLKEMGLHDSDDKRLTLLVHSMGGLVSRWFIEQEGGNKAVDHLVMFGTPNRGSPFGKVGGARKLSSLLTTLAINAFPAFAPFGGALLSVLVRSKKVTPTLEQMNPASDFIKSLNASDDPGVPYTIVAGDIRDYQEESDRLIPQLIAKLGGGVLFDTLYQDAGHDIAVSDESIRAVPADRTPSPEKRDVICHHLNYFASDAGLSAMAAVKW